MSATTTSEPLWFMNTCVTVRAASDEGADPVSVIESLAPEGDSPPLHIHHTEDEIFHVLEGDVRVRVGDQEVQLRTGETALGPRGIPHSYRVESNQARMLVITGAGDFERFVRSFSRLAEHDGLPEPTAPPTPEQVAGLATAAREHGIEIIGPPL
jgi:quercetin dioxygenase-like cupin family protein